MSSPLDSQRAEAIIRTLSAPPFPDDPYALFAELRTLAPVHDSESSGMWFASSYEAAAQVLRSPSFGQGKDATLISSHPLYERSAVLQALGQMITYVDPPDHTRLRRLVSRAFSPRVIDRLRTYVMQVIDELLVPIARDGGGDLVTDYADHIPVTVVCYLLGVPQSDHSQCRAWSEEIALSIEPGATEDQMKRADQAQLEYDGYFLALAQEKRSNPAEDLMTLLVQAEDEGDRLSEQELVSMATEIIGAGSETTRNLIGSGFLALLRNPGELAQLRADPGIDKSAVEEFLRYEPPVMTAVPRLVLQETELEGVTVPQGAVIGAVIAAANRDPKRFDHPDRLDLDRPDNLPLTFAPGIHHCLGASVARLEGQLAIGTVVRRFASIELVDERPPMRETCDLGPNPRGPKSLRVAVS
jgi:cytochrome P450